MNARKKAKYYKKMLLDLYEDYVQSAKLTSEVFEAAQKRILDIRSKEVDCSVKEIFDGPDDPRLEYKGDLVFNDLIKELCETNDFRRAVVFEGHTDPETGKYILEAKLTVVMPEVDE